VVAFLLILVAAAAGVLSTPATAGAHPLSTTAVLLDIGSDRVTGQVQLPIDRLAIALNQPLTSAVIDTPAKVEELRQYVTAHISATDATDGAAWAVAVTDGRVESIDDVDHLVYDLELRPSNGRLRDFRLHYDAIVHHLLSHRIFVSSRPAGTDTYTVVGLIDWESQTLTVPARAPATEQGFLAALRLGVTHRRGRRPPAVPDHAAVARTSAGARRPLGAHRRPSPKLVPGRPRGHRVRRRALDHPCSGGAGLRQRPHAGRRSHDRVVDPGVRRARDQADRARR